MGGPGKVVQRWRQHCFRWRPSVYSRIISAEPVVEVQLARKQQELVDCVGRLFRVL